MSNYDYRTYGQWSEWVWQDVHNSYERYRELPDGSTEWDYTAAPVTTGLAAPYIPDTPRQDTSEAEFDVADNNASSSKAPVYAAYPHTGMNQTAIEPEREITPNDVDTKSKSGHGSFSVHDSSHFKFGRIFKVHWAEPKGQKGTLITRRGPNAFWKLRRFLIVNAGPEGHSICLPILTYSGRGTGKGGCKPRDHAIIHSSEKPKLMPGERSNLMKPPIHCRMDVGQHLDHASRLNYTKLYTVEHNVGVEFIGRIRQSEHANVVAAYNSANLPLVAPSTDLSEPEYLSEGPLSQMSGLTISQQSPFVVSDPPQSSYGQQFDGGGHSYGTQHDDYYGNR